MGIFKKTKPGWERVSWHGNPDLGHECWRKKFGHGYVYIGIGEFDLVSYSYGANSEKARTSPRRT